ncbi:MAG TPA: hypothetical protein VGL61_10155 [Kofleriaceae bacterium]|jgi:hypothetical protein
MRWRAASGVVVVCVLGAVVAADDATSWDRTYKHGGANGGFPPCPEALGDVTVTNGKFSIPWDVTVHERPMTIGHIEGTVRPSGLAPSTVVFASPLPRAFVQVMQDDNESIDDMLHAKVKVSFESHHDGREIRVFTGESCEAWWQEDRAGLSAPAAGGTVHCDSGAYAAALWSTKQAYRSGDYARVAVPGDPTRVYRCVDGCKPGVDPLVKVEVHEVQPWAFIGECAGQTTPAPPLAATGSPKWDGTYGLGIMASQDWRCPTTATLQKLVVSKGRFSLPWNLSTDRSDGGKYDDATVGKIDGVVAADGKVTLRATVTIDEMPPEVTEIVRDGTATVAYLRTLKPTMTFALDSGAMNPSGQGRKARLTFNDDACELNYQASEYKNQQFKESDGWKVDCYSYESWKGDATYNDGDQASVGGGLYRCAVSPHCRAGTRPGRSDQWKRVGRCGSR